MDEAKTCKKVSYSFLKIFGCEAFEHIYFEKRTKLEDKYSKCVFFYYDINEIGYILWDF